MSEIKVNKISPRTACGTTTLGDSGDTFTIPAGVSITNSGTASGFGATGAASWNTTVKTGDFTAVAGEGYFVNTTSGAVNVTLPAGTAGAVVAIKDYAGTFDTNAVTLVRNGSDKIGGSAVDGTLETEGLAVTLVFIDSTQGWLVTDSGLQTEAPTALYVAATGGTITTSGDFKIHTFTGPGTFCVSNAGNAGGSNTVDYLVVAGGGSGGTNHAGGGGAGGYRESHSTPVSGPYTASPLATPTGITVTATGFPITVGAGAVIAPGSNCNGNRGSNSIFSTITSTGGGAGTGGGNPNNAPLGPGGSGGGGGRDYAPGGSGNTPPVSPSQGNNGGAGGNPPGQSAGGGGAGAVGGAGSAPDGCGGYGAGGDGVTTSITASPVTRAGGGGAGNYCGPSTNEGNGGAGGGGIGGRCAVGVAGTTNTGSGGGGGGWTNKAGGAGGSGIVVIRYKFQN